MKTVFFFVLFAFLLLCTSRSLAPTSISFTSTTTTRQTSSSIWNSFTLAVSSFPVERASERRERVFFLPLSVGSHKNQRPSSFFSSSSFFQKKMQSLAARPAALRPARAVVAPRRASSVVVRAAPVRVLERREEKGSLRPRAGRKLESKFLPLEKFDLQTRASQAKSGASSVVASVRLIAFSLWLSFRACIRRASARAAAGLFSRQPRGWHGE